jgi:hypothetical protein
MSVELEEREASGMLVYNKALSQWEERGVGNVTKINEMFHMGVCRYNGDLRQWNVSNIIKTNMIVTVI